MACGFCDAVSSHEREIVRNRHWILVLADNQAYLGRALLILQGHKKTVSDLSPDEWSALKELMGRYETAVSRTLGAASFNWTCLMNDAFKAQKPDPHMHWHVWPRYSSAPVMGGQTYPDPNFAHHYDKTAERFLTTDETARLIQILRGTI